jgi:hypothetical protein
VSLTEELKISLAKTLIASNRFSGQIDMDWREVTASLRAATFGLLATAIFLTLFRAFLAAHLV